ncbi:hypothetical protein AQY21_20435 [Paracoccus sp. MKU1]|nr:hypothetical protein AQY21_20435 [Paracoccus sp. MKU1]
MQPGDRFTVQRGALEESIPSIFHNDVWFTPADRVLGNIIGSAWTHSFHVDDRTGDVTFRRHEETGERFYSAPDRR